MNIDDAVISIEKIMTYRGISEEKDLRERLSEYNKNNFDKCQEEINLFCDNHPLWVMDDIFEIIKKYIRN